MRKSPVLAVALAAAALLTIPAAAQGGPSGPAAVQLAAAQTAAEAPVLKLHDALVAAMKVGKSKPFADRVRGLGPVVQDSFNFDIVTEIAAGPYWNRMSEPERKSLVDAFSAYSVAKYTANFDEFSGERFELVGQKPGPAESVWVLTRLITGGQSINFNYLVRPYGGSWRIVDVYTMGSISEVSTQRSQFMSILRDGGVSGLLKALSDRTSKLQHEA